MKGIVMMLACMAAAGAARAADVRPVVEVEEDVYRYQPANNGAGPMWTYGNTCLVRVGKNVLASGIETLPDYKPLNNVRWTLFKRGESGWDLAARGDGTHEREPCPIVAFPDGRVFLSTNPNACAPQEADGKATPKVLQFSAKDPAKGHQEMVPPWDRPLDFHGHTYRTFIADAPRKEFLLFYNTAYDRAYWTFYDDRGQWSKQGALEFPWGAEYDEPEPVRICYPTVALRNRAVYFCGVSDVVEPYKAWRQYKKELTGQEWDYDFRRLFFTWSEDITTGKFHPWVEIASHDKTCGWVSPCDLYVAADGAAHILWSARAIDERLRAKFFPEAKQSIGLYHAIVREGRVVERQAIQEWKEGDASGERAGNGRFAVAPGGRLFVFYYVSGTGSDGKPLAENRLVEIRRGRMAGQPVRVAMQKPLSSFFTATPRGGSAPSRTLDLLGDAGGTLRYARIRLW